MSSAVKNYFDIDITSFSSVCDKTKAMNNCLIQQSFKH